MRFYTFGEIGVLSECNNSHQKHAIEQVFRPVGILEMQTGGYCLSYTFCKFKINSSNFNLSNPTSTRVIQHVDWYNWNTTYSMRFLRNRLVIWGVVNFSAPFTRLVKLVFCRNVTTATDSRKCRKYWKRRLDATVDHTCFANSRSTDPT